MKFTVSTRGIIVGVFLAVLLVALVGCGGSGNPEATVEKMVKAAEAHDMEAFLDCLGPVSREVVAGMMEVMGEEQTKLVIAKDSNVSGKIESSKIDGDRATVKVVDGEGKSHDITLVLVGGEWKVEFPEFARMSADGRKKMIERARQMKKMMDQAAKMGQGFPGQLPSKKGK